MTQGRVGVAHGLGEVALLDAGVVGVEHDARARATSAAGCADAIVLEQTRVIASEGVSHLRDRVVRD